MSLWTSSVLGLLLLQGAAPSEERPRPVLLKKDWNLTQAYADVFNILSNQNTCSSFYGGPRTATTVLNDFVAQVKTTSLGREVSFQQMGRPRIFHSRSTGASYRLFDRAMVNSNGSFYQRRDDPLRRFPSYVGHFPPGSRQARALILLHELGHLIQGEDGDWLLPDDGFNGTVSNANTLRVQQQCRAQLDALK